MVRLSELVLVALQLSALVLVRLMRLSELVLVALAADLPKIVKRECHVHLLVHRHLHHHPR